MPTLTLLRNATLLLAYEGGPTLLVDPMLAEPGTAPPVPMTLPTRRNPLTPLRMPAADAVAAADVVLATHLHNDHFDTVARGGAIPRETRILCQPPDADALRGDGFTHVEPVEERATVGAVEIERVVAHHTLDPQVTDLLGPGSGYVLRAPGEPTVYLGGDCVWCDDMAATLDRAQPDVVVLNGGAARFQQGGHITMTATDVIAAARHAPQAHVVVVHLEALNHCPMTRDELRRHTVAAGLADRVRIPLDGEELALA